MKKESKRRQVEFYFKPLPKIPNGASAEKSRLINRQRGDSMKKNTAKFFVHLYQKIYGGRVLDDGEGIFHDEGLPLFIDEYTPQKFKFYPDIYQSNGSEKYIEVKATCANHPQPFFGATQTAGRMRNLIKNPVAQSEVVVFTYGSRETETMHICKGKKEKFGCHNCNYRCFANVACNNVRSLLILPSNLVSLVLAFSKTETMERIKKGIHTNSRYENYRRPLGRVLTVLRKNFHEPETALGKIMDKVGYNPLDFATKWKLGQLKPEDFFLQDLTATQTQSPNNLWWRNFHINQFPIIRYRNTKPDEWRARVIKDSDEFLHLLGVNEIYQDQEAEIMQEEMLRQARQAQTLEESVDYPELPKKPDDNIPF